MPRYQHAPLRYVLFAAELNPVTALAERAVLDRVHAAVADLVPHREDQAATTAYVAPDGQVRPLGGGARLSSADRTLAAIIAPARIAIDTTVYTTFSAFSALVERFIAAVAAEAPGRTCNRLALRYIDEIRVPGVEGEQPGQWAAWIDKKLLPRIATRGVQSRHFAGVIDDQLGGGYAVRFTWQTAVGYSVAPVGPLIVPDPAPPGTPYFLIDTDSRWDARPDGPIIALGGSELLDAIETLHDPIQERFENSITQRLRDEVLIPEENEDDEH